MAKYVEGKDFEWVQGNSGKGNFKTRRFFTAAEKKAMAAPKAAAKPASKAASKAAPKKETPAKPLVTPKVETMKGMSPAGGRGDGRKEMVIRRTEGALKKAAAKPAKVSYEAWDKMSRAERKAKGYPVSVTGFQNWRQ